MTVQEAKKYARRKTLQGTSIILAILVFVYFFAEIRGDFANGILFFFAALLNIHTIILTAILLVLTYYFAGNAGEEIIIEKQKAIIVSLKYTILITLSISAYAITIGVFRENDFTLNGVKNVVSTYFLGIFLKTGFGLLIVWLWATTKMKSVRP